MGGALARRGYTTDQRYVTMEDRRTSMWKIAFVKLRILLFVQSLNTTVGYESDCDLVVHKGNFGGTCLYLTKKKKLIHF